MTGGYEPLPPPTEPPPEPPRRFPFWTYTDLFVFLGMALVSLWLGLLIVHGIFVAARLAPRSRAVELLPAQFLGYAILFWLLAMLLKVQYRAPFWQSMRWVAPRTRPAYLVALGIVMAFVVSLLGVALRTPDLNNPMKELLSDRTSVILIAIFGTTLGPFFEELGFRGFMQPLFVRSLGAVPGVLLAAAAFGALHLQEYGWSWRHGLLITLAGAAFGWVRHRTGSTLASTIMHAAYNGVFFLALLAQRQALPQKF